MTTWQQLILLVFSIYSFMGIILGYLECRKKNAFNESNWFIPLGAWVWGDVFVFGVFWSLVSAFILIRQDWILILLITSVFWTIRSLGEVSYWIHQQFSVIERNPPKNLRFYSLFKNDSIWFVYQIVWQCVAVISIIFVLYFTEVWLFG